VIGALEGTEDYQAFEAAVIADCNAQSAIERELVLRLASLLWRLRRATTVETGLFKIQANHLKEFKEARQVLPISHEIIYAVIREAESVSYDRKPQPVTSPMEAILNFEPSVCAAMPQPRPAVERG
jgi:hypothetical protein